MKSIQQLRRELQNPNLTEAERERLQDLLDRALHDAKAPKRNNNRYEVQDPKLEPVDLTADYPG